jgi:hypothetical protein
LFDLLQLNGTPPSGIALQTRLGQDIENEHGPTLSDKHRTQYDLLVEKFGQRWERRKPATSGYNCAGHIWASRRTAIYEDSEWMKILSDDGYRQTKNPRADDIVIYSEADLGFLHIGRILDIKPQLVGSDRETPWIASKWSDTTGEVCHWLEDHVFPVEYNLSIAFWTDRPSSSPIE